MTWPWKPGIALASDARVFRVSASDAETAGRSDHERCALAQALKVRPRTWPETGGWRRRRGDRDFALGPLTEAIEAFHHDRDNGIDFDTALRNAHHDLGPTHPGLRRFLDVALDNYVEYHDAREHEIGSLHYLGLSHEFGLKLPLTITAWAPLYETDTGIREIRRLRLDKASSAPTAWAEYAALVAAAVDTGRPVRQVFVTEVGLRDGAEKHVLPGVSPDDARTRYAESARHIALDIAAGISRTTGNDCASCSFCGGCPDLVPVPGALQVDRHAAWTRSVSARDLTLYEQCPAQWYLHRLLHLPADGDHGEARDRGKAAHDWIAAAHQRGIPCAAADLPDPDAGLGLAEGILTRTQYQAARPYLLRHVDVCPLAAGPYLQVAFTLCLLAHGLTEHHECSRGEVELEVLTPHGAAVFSYATDDPDTITAAREHLKAHTTPWARDTTWLARPGGDCDRCPVRIWCPDRADDTPRSLAALAAVEDEPAPF